MPRVPMISALVISAPSQCERSMSSRPETPGKRYLLPPEKPTTSCGKTGPTISVTSCSTTARLIRTSTAAREQAAGQLGDPLGGDRADVGERRRVPPLVVEHRRRRDSARPSRRAGSRDAPPARRSLIAAWVPSATSTVSRADPAVQRAVHRRRAAAAAGSCGWRRARARRRCARRGRRAASCSRDERADLLARRGRPWDRRSGPRRRASTRRALMPVPSLQVCQRRRAPRTRYCRGSRSRCTRTDRLLPADPGHARDRAPALRGGARPADHLARTATSIRGCCSTTSRSPTRPRCSSRPTTT